MKQRLISVAVGLVLLAVVLVLFDTAAVNIALSLISALCIFEALRAYNLHKYTALLAVLVVANTADLFLYQGDNKVLLPQYSVLSAYSIAVVMIFAMFALLIIADGNRGKFSQGVCALVPVLVVNAGMRSILILRDMGAATSDSRFLFIMALCFAWIGDTFAFFCGHKWGKRKLSPYTSPHKTVAGGIGAVVGTSLTVALIMWIYHTACGPQSLFAAKTSLECVLFGLGSGFIGSLLGILGDLAMSFVKRDAGIKDFGNVMPGHGGALDRMDSVLFTAVFAVTAFRFFFAGELGLEHILY